VPLEFRRTHATSRIVIARPPMAGDRRCQ
jgi:hypothetical protein